MFTIELTYDCDLCKKGHESVGKVPLKLLKDEVSGGGNFRAQATDAAKIILLKSFFKAHPEGVFNVDKLKAVEITAFSEDEVEKEEVTVSIIANDVQQAKAQLDLEKQGKPSDNELSLSEVESEDEKPEKEDEVTKTFTELENGAIMTCDDLIDVIAKRRDSLRDEEARLKTRLVIVQEEAERLELMYKAVEKSKKTTEEMAKASEKTKK